ncbi:MAG: secondary thiamine-phosphate synthase enzyme YjbQ [Armatimonadota bacterium]
MHIVELSTRTRSEFVDITRQVMDVVAKSDIKSGVAVICSAHTTAGVTINENADPDVVADMGAMLDQIVPRHHEYQHGEGNSDAHIKASLVGLSVMVPIEDRRLVLGTWQGIYFCEFDGPRRRKVVVQLLPGG